MMRVFKTGICILLVLAILPVFSACKQDGKPASVPYMNAFSTTPHTWEKYTIDPENGRWSYSNRELSVTIQKIHSNILRLTYFLADIRIKNFKAIQSGFSNRVHPGLSPANPARTALSYDAVYAQNGDWFLHPANKQGMVIRNGIVFYNREQLADTIIFLPDGTIRLFKPGETTVQALLKAGVNDALSFGPILVRDGTVNPDLKESHIFKPYARSGFGMAGRNHFFGIVTEGAGVDGSRGVTLDEFARLFLHYRCPTAYNLDGGPSSAMIFMGKMLNKHNLNNGKTYTPVPDILIMGTSPTVGKINK